MRRTIVGWSAQGVGNSCWRQFLSVGVLAGMAGSALAQEDAEPSALSGFAPPIKMIAPAEARSKEHIGTFVESLRSNDAMFEVVLGQGRLLTLKSNLAVANKPSPVIAVGDPTVVDFEVVGSRQIRVTGRRFGVTDLSVITADGESYSFEVQVVADLKVLRAKLHAIFPDALINMAQLHDHVVVEGQARDVAQSARIIQLVQGYLGSLQAAETINVGGGSGTGTVETPAIQRRTPNAPAEPGERLPNPRAEVVQAPGQFESSATVPQPQVINMLRVPGSQQVMLKVQIAELNRTAFRQLGASFLFHDGSTALGTNPTGAAKAAGGLAGLAAGFPNVTTTVAGSLADGKFQYFIDALRRNSVLKILAEPNLIAYHGHQGSFLAGGEFPVPVVQGGTSVGGAVPTVQFREFGVRLGFIPYIQDDNVIRLAVASEVSSIDRSLGTTLIAGGEPIPGLNTRKSQTTVELREGQTLAIAGLLQLTLDAETNRIPGLGDLPYLGPFFSNNTGKRVEKELVVLVTPYLVEPMTAEQVGMRPGDEVTEPNDLEFYLLGRIEGRVGRDFRSTTKWDDPLDLVRRCKLERRYICGPNGFSE